MIRKAPLTAVAVVGSYLVMPEHIDTSRTFWDSFGRMEAEQAARWIVVHMQSVGSWQSVPKDLQARQLVEAGWLVFGEDGQLLVTDAFIRRCFDSSPVLATGGTPS